MMPVPRRLRARGGGRTSRAPAHRRVSVLAAALLALGAALLTISLLPAPAPEVVLNGQRGEASLERSQPADPLAAGPARLAVEAFPAVQGPVRVRTAGFAALRAEIDWDKTEDIESIDTDPGGKLQFDPESGRIRICDANSDDHVARGYAILDGKEVAFAHIGSKGHCKEAEIPDYKRTTNYQFKVCIARSNSDPDGYCNTSNTTQWPKEDKKNDSCWDLKTDQEKIDCVGGVKEFCNQWQHTSGMFPKQCEKDHADKKSSVLRPPTNRKPDVNARPDASLPRGHAKGVGAVTEPIQPLLQWMVWTALTACVLGFILVGGNMGLKHKRGEFGAHATDLKWVLLACVMAGSGLALAFVTLLIDNF
ncbi:hypothetical protein BKA00_005091 [Actinomadura coerulea]|uniref:Uncharacterized protein n=1 Tax=Actinomadura coerulea TaxID=46159 RepID=A0A7X0L162_9ACTN|nr:hypothetical protein [Actinomadura coerulea]MBB6398177.1 hypothetical protein [Actinomadura coerulea]